MPKRMLIDASHPEETRVVVLDGQKVEEFDFESAAKRPLKGNIYLAKVTRVEPSLQAAFVEYGGNRQGFLAFSEIHPDYYQIPVADRQALLAEQEAEARRRGDDDFEAVETAKTKGERKAAPVADSDEEEDEEAGESVAAEAGEGEVSPSADISDDEADAEPVETQADDETAEAQDETSETEDEAEAETAATQPLQSQRPSQRWMRKRHYKIQEVIKRRQVMLIQVVKEERGNKGAALTTYLSLAGRYCVLMPNTPRGGGISRKITNASDRKRLKSAAASLELPEGMGLIIRTAGANRTKLEIKRDYEYLLRMWDSIRELTLKSNAPACVYEEGDLIKRAIRDLYNKDVSEVVVEGEEGYRNAKDFMRMLMPSHAKNVKQYKDTVPLFHKHHIESQLDAMFSPTVTLKSGGYLVINQTEALVAIDVNSGRATREHNIEDTAYKTNLEAAEEVGRQLRLRDLAGLIVIDFIDMEDSRNDRNVEKRLREAVKTDRARVQIGKISQFGLLEMSRQRLRAGVIAGSTIPCPHCEGQGIVRSVESTALRVLRGLEEEGQKQRASAVTVHVPGDVAVYTLNQKRRELMRIEGDYGMTIAFEPDTAVLPGNFEIDRTEQKSAEERAKAAVTVDTVAQSEEATPEVEERTAQNEADGEREGGGRRRRRRRRSRDRDRDRPAVMQESVPSEGETEFDAERAAEASDNDVEVVAQPAEEGDGKRKRRRRRRGRRGRRDNGTAGETGEDEALEGVPVDSSVQAGEEGAEAIIDTAYGAAIEPNTSSEPVWSLSTEMPPVAAEAPQPAAPATEEAEDVQSEHSAAEPVVSPESGEEETVAVIAPEAPQPMEVEETPRATAEEEADEPAPVTAAPEAEAENAAINGEEAPAGPPRKGWWQRPFRARE